MGNRIYHAVQQVGIKATQDATFTAIHGLQSVGLNTTLNNSPVSQLGNIFTYDTLENLYDTELTLRKVLDGYPLIYTLATSDATSPSLEDRIMQRCSIALSIFDDSNTYASGVPLAIVQYTGIFVSSFRYNFNVNNNFEEEVSFIGNNRIWSNDVKIVNATDLIDRNNLSFDGIFNNTDSPLSSAGINRRQDLIFNGAIGDTTILPKDIIGVNSSGQPTSVHVSNISISANINREPLYSLGSIVPYFRLPTFPIDITSEFTVNAISGDVISLTEPGIRSSDVSSCGRLGNISGQVINIATCEGTRIDLGYNNKLSAVTYQGGDAGGGFVTVSYTYKSSDVCTILHSEDATHEDWWDERAGIMTTHLPTGSDKYAVYYGISQLLWDNLGSPTNNISLSIWPLSNSDLYKLNMKAIRVHEGITGILIQEKITKINNVAVSSPSWVSVYSGITCTTGCEQMLMNIYPSIITSGVIGSATYQYRAKGIYADRQFTASTAAITTNIAMTGIYQAFSSGYLAEC